MIKVQGKRVDLGMNLCVGGGRVIQILVSYGRCVAYLLHDQIDTISMDVFHRL